MLTQITLSVATIEFGMQERVLLLRGKKCVSSERTFKRIFAGSLGTTSCARRFYCFLLLILQKSYEMGTFIIAPILHSRKLRLTDFQRLTQVLLVSERQS